MVPSASTVHQLTQAEDGREERVADFQRERDDPRLVVVLDAHADHVEEDEHENGDFKPEEEG